MKLFETQIILCRNT